jgi:hypothetical protein
VRLELVFFVFTVSKATVESDAPGIDALSARDTHRMELAAAYLNDLVLLAFEV